MFIKEVADGVTVGQGSSYTASSAALNAGRYVQLQAPSILVNGPITLLNADPEGRSGDHPLLENRNGVLYWNEKKVSTSDSQKYNAGFGITIDDDTNVIGVKLGDGNQYLGFDSNGTLVALTGDTALATGPMVTAVSNQLKTYTITEFKKIKGTLGYLYDVTYTDYSYNDAMNYSAPAMMMRGACSTYRKGNYVARNFDWYYDDVVEFVVKSNKPGCHRVIGIASGVGDGDNNLTKKEMEEHTEVQELYKYVPFFLVDGINDAGLVVSEHVVPHSGDEYGNDNRINKVNPSTPDTAECINAMFLPRYLLDHCSSVQDVKTYLENKIVTQPQEAFNAGFELHYLINDANGNYMVIEFDNNKVVFVESNKLPNCLANFHVLPTKGEDASRGTLITLGPKFIDDDSTKSKRLCTPADVSGSDYKPSIENKVEMYGQGLERYNFMIKEVTGENSALYDGPNTEFEVMDKMSGIWFSNVYQNHSPFNTEFTGDSTSIGYTHLTVDSTAADYDAGNSIKTGAINLWSGRSRDDDPKRYWQTTHCVVYNIENRSLLVKVQESAKESEWDYQFKLAVYRGLDKSQDTYVVPRFHDDAGYDGSQIKCEHEARYELKSSGNNPHTYTFNTWSSLVIGPSETIELHFDVNSSATYPGPIYQVEFPSEWLWIDEYEGTIDSMRFSDGNTYDIAVRNDGREIIANVAYEYTTVVSGPFV